MEKVIDNSWWSNKKKSSSNKLSHKTFDKFLKDIPDSQPSYFFLHTNHDKHKLQVKAITGKGLRKDKCYLCKMNNLKNR